MASSGTPRRFKPEPIEITVMSSKDRVPNIINRETTAKEEPSVEGDCTAPAAPRRFTPQLIGTSKRIRRAGDTTPAVLPIDKTEATPGVLGDELRNIKNGQRRIVPVASYSTPICETSRNPLFLEIKQRAEFHLMRPSRSRGSTRSQRSFRVPELEPILSSESETSNPPSLSTSPSAISDYSFMYKDTRDPETTDDRFSNYVLELEARTAEKQLHDQAMAAFPNHDHHEPVDHFIDRDGEESEVGSLMEIPTFTEVDWDLAAMRQHRENLERQQKAEREKKKQLQAQLNRDRENPYGPWHHPVRNENIIGGWQKDGELDCMRKGARPPMLGADITFPRCSSPEPARFDPTQRCVSLRNTPSQFSEHHTDNGGLWCTKETPTKQPTLWSNPPSRPASRGGLWGGCCKDTNCTPQPPQQTGLMTPQIEINNPMDTATHPPQTHLPPTPISTPDPDPEPPLSLEQEFTDDFVTQVYNYLSLGYPSIARNFDEELSKISGIPVEELRQDDRIAMPRGYIRLGEDGNLKDVGITEEGCIRWRALRLYIREWVRQQPDFVERDGEIGGMGLGFGTAARKGSWAV